MESASRRARWTWAVIPGVAAISVSVAAAATDGKEEAAMPMTIESPSFAHDHPIPSRHTCDGQGVSPPLAWSGVPAGARSLVLIADDPDAPDPAAPRMTWVHWVVYNIPVSVESLAEGAAASGLPAGALHGVNDWQRSGYGGPCPPIGRHRYFFKLYALDAVLPDLKHPTKTALEKAMQGHVLAQSRLVGLYRRK